MRKSRFTEEHIALALRHVDAGGLVTGYDHVCRRCKAKSSDQLGNARK